MQKSQAATEPITVTEMEALVDRSFRTVPGFREPPSWRRVAIAELHDTDWKGHFDLLKTLASDATEFYLCWMSKLKWGSNTPNNTSWVQEVFDNDQFERIARDQPGSRQPLEAIFNDLPLHFPVPETVKLVIGLRLCDALWANPSAFDGLGPVAIQLVCVANRLVSGTAKSSALLFNALLNGKDLKGHRGWGHKQSVERDDLDWEMTLVQAVNRIVDVAHDSFQPNATHDQETSAWPSNLVMIVVLALSYRYAFRWTHHRYDCKLTPDDEVDVCDPHDADLALMARLTSHLASKKQHVLALSVDACAEQIRHIRSTTQAFLKASRELSVERFSAASKTTQTTTPAGESTSPKDAATLVVCPAPFAPGKDEEGLLQACEVLLSPLPLAAMPDVARIEQTRVELADEFPWASDVIRAVFEPLVAKSLLGCQSLHIEPTLFAGHPGSGKSRFMRRLTEVLGLARLDLPLGGVSDDKAISGTGRGWSTGRPNDVLMTMVSHKTATVAVNADELEKVGSSTHNGNVHHFLLSLLEPETSKSFRDAYLKTPCNLSGVIWLATANGLETLSSALKSRFRILHLEQPKREHHEVIAQGVLKDLATLWRVPLWSLPKVTDLDVPWDRLSSAREVRKAVEVGVVRQTLSKRNAAHSLN